MLSYPIETKTRICLFLILIATFLCFLPGLDNGYVTWDDDHLIVHNPLITEFSLTNLKEIFAKPFLSNYHPLTLLTWTLEHQLFGFNFFAYHFNNVLLHLFNVILVFWLFFLLTKNVPLALIVSCLFAIHPTRVEAVTWLSARKDVLYSFFYLLSCIFYLKHKEKKKLLFISLSFGMFFLSLLSKPMAITLPFLLFIFDYYQEKKISWKDSKNKWLFLIAALIFAWVCYVTHASFKVKPSLFNSPFFFNVIFGWHSILHYLKIIFFPIHLSPFYPYPEYNTLFWIPQWISVSISFVLFYLFIRLIDQFSKKLTFGFLFFFVAALPILKMFPAGGTLAADRFTYLPALGFFYLSAEFCLYLYNKLKANRMMLSASVIFFLIIFLFLGLSTAKQQRIWRDSLHLWSEILKQNPDLFVAYFNRANAHYREGNYQASVDDFRQGIIRYPFYEKAYFGFGAALLHVGKEKEGLQAFEKALKFKQELLEVYLFRGGYFYKKGDYAQAIPDFEKALKLDPGDSEIIALLHECRGKVNDS